MNANDAVILEWRYTPADFFEESVVVSGPDYEIRIEDGKATATVAPEAYDEEHKKRDELHGVVEAYFRAVQLAAHRKFTLPKKPVMSRVHPDGRRDVTLCVHDALQAQAACHIDIVARDAAGNILRDTKRERIDAERALAEAIGRLRPQDSLLEKLLDSYQAAVEDPANELVHLFEILEALKARFRSDQKAQEALGIEETKWGRFFALTNDRQLQQSRHRGQHLGELRKATAAELDEARRTARGFIEAYVWWAKAAKAGSDGI